MKGLFVPILPLAVRTASSLQKGVRLFHAEERDMSIIPNSITGECYSRIGLVGNPSDGYYGNCLSVSVNNFSTKVVLLKSDRIQVIPNPE